MTDLRLDPAAEAAAIPADPETGAVVTFTGHMRGQDGEEEILAMTLEHYPGMTERQLAAIAAEAERRWSLRACRVAHRHGRILPGEAIVVVATAARHRRDAFAAAEFLMDWLKTRAPFWKREETKRGMRWVAARAEDDAAAARWEST